MSPAQSDGKVAPLDAGSDINLLSSTCNGVGNGHSCCSRGNYSANCITTDRAFAVDVGLKRGDIEMAADGVLKNGSCSMIVAANDKDDSEAADNSFLSLPGKVDNNSHLLVKDEIMLSQLGGMSGDQAKGTGFGQAGSRSCLGDVELASSLDGAEETDMASGYETPTEGMFDPFAPGPQELACAPKKILSMQDRLPLRRQLKFDSPGDDCEGMHGSEADDSAEDDKIAEVLHSSLLEVIMKSQLDEGLLTESITSDEPTTPTATCLLPGISDACPGAPLRHALKPRKIDATICRRLDFSEDI